MLKKIVFYINLGYKLIKKDVIGNKDYQQEYNKVATTYNKWLDEMGKYTDNIIKPEYVSKENKLKILDFACGTGYISRSLIEKNIDCEITAVDFSNKMLEQLKGLEDDRVKVINCDGIEFLRSTNETYDCIFFGWALSYFDYRELFKLFKKVLNQGGVIGIISNTIGTLSGIEDIFMKVMGENQEEVIKPMDIRFNLPQGKAGLIRWFRRCGFEPLEAKEGEVKIVFDSPELLLKWLNETGAAAGTTCIFKDYNLIKDKLLERIRKEKYKNGKYEINHKFAYGIFRLI